MGSTNVRVGSAIFGHRYVPRDTNVCEIVRSFSQFVPLIPRCRRDYGIKVKEDSGDEKDDKAGK